MKTHTLHIVCSKTNTNVGKLIRIFTKDDINHCSIYFDNEKELYSCRREYKYNLFSGKCGIETFEQMACGKNMYYEQIDIPITNIEYKKIKKIINDSLNMKYDYVALFAMNFNLRFRLKNRFVCSSYVAYILNQVINLNEDYKDYTPILLRDELLKKYQVKNFTF